MKIEPGHCYLFKGGSPLKNQPVWTGTVVAISIEFNMAWIRYENGMAGQWYYMKHLEVVQELK